MKVTIRKAILGDQALLARLNMAVHQPHFEKQPDRYKALTPDDPELIAIFASRLADETCITLIAEDDNQGIGYMQLFIRQRPDNPFVHRFLECHIDQLAVMETHQNQGIGKQLMQAAMEIAQEHQADAVTLGVVAFNEGAIRFYERLGFKISSHRMALRLGDE